MEVSVSLFGNWGYRERLIMSSSQLFYCPGSLVGAKGEEQQGRGCEVAGVRGRYKDADNGDFTFQFWPSLLKKTGQEADSFV